jgi:hypothetical protein
MGMFEIEGIGRGFDDMAILLIRVIEYINKSNLCQ